MLISPFTPLFFVDRKADGIESDYIQTFADTDKILIEVLGDPGESFSAGVYREPDHSVLFPIRWQEWMVNDVTRLRFAVLSLTPGLYSVVIGGRQSETFRVTDDSRELEKTTLIQYSMKNNRQRNDAVFFIDHMQYFFDFRVHGGFKDSNWSFGVDSEQFTTRTADISQLYGLESTQKRFTMGQNEGVPVWFGEMLNRILVCSHVYFDGVKYSRKESNVPEITVQLEGVNSFVFNQAVQRSVNLDPVIEQTNQAIIRRTESYEYRSTSQTYNRLIN